MPLYIQRQTHKEDTKWPENKMLLTLMTKGGNEPKTKNACVLSPSGLLNIL